ncbi:TPA: hypothetical protein NGT97_004491 [Vibrio parahaemolyticus]|uniref:hypothetical protein n=1 Tax=Vibrio parahaemolyticus TaxID=670 RepID=UPI001A33705A|nr:hypothetical protein [Vibrio parahaemolyticus]HAS6505923.1 hypothetical protein [Vibrio parahaemolyticus]HCE2478756.1 hypothetical protein [Vibrio parahaemolyticus]
MNKPNVEDIYSLIGVALVQIQSLESLMKFCTTYVLQEGDFIDFEGLTRLEKKEKKKTLGYFIGRVKERADVHPNLLRLLESFLENRNMLVHNVDSVPDWDLNTIEGTKAAKMFVGNLIRQTSVLTHIFSALVNAWQQQVGLGVKLSDSEQKVIDEIHLEYGPIIDELFMEKET